VIRCPLTALCLILPMLAALPAGARCVTEGDLAGGVAFTRADGRSGLAKRQADGRIAVDYDTGDSEWLDQRVGPFGLYEEETEQQFSDLPVVGSGPMQVTAAFTRKPPTPEPGGSWTGTLRGKWYQPDGTEKGFTRGRVQRQVEYRFLEERKVKLSGCEYRVIAVEAAAEGGRQRWIYFADLGLGLETVSPRGKAGLVALKPARP